MAERSPTSCVTRFHPVLSCRRKRGTARSFGLIVFALSYVRQRLEEWEFQTLVDVPKEEIDDLISALCGRETRWSD